MVILDQAAVDQVDDLLLDTVRSFIEAHGGLAEVVGGVELLLISDRKYCVCVHVQGLAPPQPGAPADA